MDWLRRNWPDMLIGLALVAVIAGIVATLLTGGSFFPLGGGGTTAGPGTGLGSPPSVDVGRTDPGDGQPSAGAPASDAGLAGPAFDGPEVAVLPGDDAAATEGGLADPDAGPPGAPDPDVTSTSTRGAAQPLAPGDEPAATPAAGAAVDPPSEATAAPLPSGQQDVVLPSPEGQDGAAEGTADANAALPTEPFRVSVGAFGDAANAERQADRFRDEGYPVFIGRQGEFHIVLVGPYEDEAEARDVAGEIDEGDFGIDPVIYRFQPDDSAGAGSVQANAAVPPAPVDEGAADGDAAGAPAGDEGAADDESPAAEAADVPAAAVAAEGRLLQVGAYADVESAQPQVQRLESLGLTARRLQESGMVKLVVGPLSGEALEDARVVLEGAGIDYFAR